MRRNRRAKSECPCVDCPFEGELCEVGCPRLLSWYLDLQMEMLEELVIGLSREDSIRANEDVLDTVWEQSSNTTRENRVLEELEQASL